jgi:hypothetical protein
MPGIPKEQREAVGVFDDLVRLSCGIEDAEDSEGGCLAGPGEGGGLAEDLEWLQLIRGEQYKPQKENDILTPGKNAGY